MPTNIANQKKAKPQKGGGPGFSLFFLIQWQSVYYRYSPLVISFYGALLVLYGGLALLIMLSGKYPFRCFLP